jgi:hypothetical protein
LQRDIRIKESNIKFYTPFVAKKLSKKFKLGRFNSFQSLKLGLPTCRRFMHMLKLYICGLATQIGEWKSS